MRCFMNMTAAIKRAAALALSLALLFAPAGALAAAGRSHQLTIGIVGGTSDYINPLVSPERDLMALTGLIYEGLVLIDDDYEPHPVLAERWEASSDGSNWTFYLKEGLTFHDGTPLTSADVVATINEIKRLATEEGVTNRGPYASLRYLIEKATASGELTVEIRTNRKNYGFLFGMTFPVLPASAIQAGSPPGTGPYRLAKHVPDNYMMLTANQDWWGGSLQIEDIMAVFHAGNSDLVSSYEYNRVDAILTRALNAAQYRSGVSTLNIPYRTKQLETLLFSYRSYELEDAKVRKAIRFAINIESLANGSYMGMVIRSDTLMPVGTWMQGGVSSTLRQDTARARTLLAEAGWGDPNEGGILTKMIDGKRKVLSLNMVVYDEGSDGARLSTAQQIAMMLMDVGIEARVTSLPFSDAQARLKAGNFDLALAAFNMDAVPDPGFLLISGNTGNYMRYKSERMDQLFKELRATMDKEMYIQKLYEIQAQFVEDCPLVSLYYRNGAIITRTMFTNARDLREPDVLRGIGDY